jgi:hypothetical protein
MKRQFARNTLGLAAEFAVASELCRRGIYAQLTYGYQKRTDILVFSESGELARIEVKAKQETEWPNCKGIFGKKMFLIFVDYKDLELNQRPDFYILSSSDWRKVLEKRVETVKAKNPRTRIEITEENVSIFIDQIGSNGKPYMGMGIRSPDLKEYKEDWDKIAKDIG